MFSETKIATEFLSLLNTFLSEVSFAGQMRDFLTPLRLEMQKNDDQLIAFSLARYSGANQQLAFFCQLLYFSVKFGQNSDSLFDENHKLWSKKVPITLRGLPNLNELVKQDTYIFLPNQLAFLQGQVFEMLFKLASDHRFLQKYLQPDLLDQIIIAQWKKQQILYEPEMTLGQFVESLNHQLEWLQVGLPCLLGLRFYAYQLNSPGNPEEVQWVILEEILKQISFLYYTRQNFDLAEFIYLKDLSDGHKFSWWQQNKQGRQTKLLQEEQVMQKAKEIRKRTYQKASYELSTLIFPDKKPLLKSLLLWAWGEEEE